MQKIIDFLEENAIDYRQVNYGNSDYYNDGFIVPAVMVSFNYEMTNDLDGLQKKKRIFLQYMSRRKNHCIAYMGKSGIYIPWYSVMGLLDYRRLLEHESRIHTDVEKFWIKEHAKQEAERIAATM